MTKGAMAINLREKDWVAGKAEAGAGWVSILCRQQTEDRGYKMGNAKCEVGREKAPALGLRGLIRSAISKQFP